MRLDGDEIRHHDDECSLDRPCADCEREEHERQSADNGPGLLWETFKVVALIALAYILTYEILTVLAMLVEW